MTTGGITEQVAVYEEWTHVACVYDGNERIIYINGEKKASQVIGAGTVDLKNIKIGAHFAFSSGCYLKGNLSNFRIWTKGLDSVAIRQVMNGDNIKYKEHLFLYYKMDEEDLEIAFDSSDNQNDGIIFGGVSSSNGYLVASIGEGKFNNGVLIEPGTTNHIYNPDLKNYKAYSAPWNTSLNRNVAAYDWAAGYNGGVVNQK